MASFVWSTNISFSSLKSAYALGDDTSADKDSNLRDGKSNTAISLSFFRNSRLTDNTSIPSGSNSISINNFKDKTFGVPGSTFTTGNFNFHINFTGENDRLYPVSSASSYYSTTSSKIARLFHSSVSYYYPSILLCPNSGDPEIGLRDNAEVWIKLELNTPRHFQVGIVHKQGESNWADVASNYLRTRHTTYRDRIALHTYGYITHAGHDIETSGTEDELMDPTTLGSYHTDTSNYHNRIGTTAGSMGGSGVSTVSSSLNYLKTNLSFYQSKTWIGTAYYLGMKINYYEITLTGTVSSSSNSNQITNVQLDGSNLTSSNNVYTGMYLSSATSGFPDCIIQSINYSGSTTINMGEELDGSSQDNYITSHVTGDLA